MSKATQAANNDGLRPANDQKVIKMKRKPMFDERGITLLNGIKLTFEKGLGFNQKPQLYNSVTCIDDNKVLYVINKQIILYDMLTESQKVVTCIGAEEEITCFHCFRAMMPEDNIAYAIQAVKKAYPTIAINSPAKGIEQRYVLANLEKEERIIRIALVKDYKYICALSELQDNLRVTFVQLSTKEIHASESIYIKVKDLVAAPTGPLRVFLSNQTDINIGRLDGELKLNPLNLSKTLLQPGQKINQVVANPTYNILYVITTKGKLHFLHIDDNDTLAKIETLTLGTYQTADQSGNPITTERCPTAMCANQYNIVIGYQYLEELTLIKLSPINLSTSTMQPIKFCCPMLHKIHSMSFAQETFAICIVAQNKEGAACDLTIPIVSQYLQQKNQGKYQQSSIQNHLLPSGKYYPVVFNLLLHDTLIQTSRCPMQAILGSLLLTKHILDLAIVPTKKLVLILSAQKSIKAIRINQISSSSFDRMLEWQSTFNVNDNPNSLSVHPLTFNVAVGFKEGLKLFTICSEGLKASNVQFPLKNCQSVRYSRFGHKLAVGSSSQIVIINPYDNQIERIFQLASGYYVQNLEFISRDMYLFTRCFNGSSQVLSLQGTRIFQVWNKSMKSIASVYDYHLDMSIVSYTESVVKFYRDRGSQQFAVMWTYPFNVTSILIVNELGTVFMGTSMGQVRSYQWPFTDMIKFSKSFTELQLHQQAVTNLQITHDYCLLISGSSDGTIYISKINPYSDGIPVSDSEILHVFRNHNKNYSSLYYLQNFVCTSGNFWLEEAIMQLESDKADFSSEYNETLSGVQQQFDLKIKDEEGRRSQQLKEEMKLRNKDIQDLNFKKMQIKEEFVTVAKKRKQDEDAAQNSKLQKMRHFYKESDELVLKRQKIQAQYAQAIAHQRHLYSQQMDAHLGQLKAQENQLATECKDIESEIALASVHNKELLKEECEQGAIYKERMLEEMAEDLRKAREEGEQLRKTYNKTTLENSKFEEKMKQIQQMLTEIELDTQHATIKKGLLDEQIKQLSQVLVNKDKQIFTQQRNLKDLLSKNINNYSHEEYLKHLQEELLSKAQFLEEQIAALNKKYLGFQQDFVSATNQANDYNAKVKNALETIQNLKQTEKQVKKSAYMKKYKAKRIFDRILEAFSQAEDTKAFLAEARVVLNKTSTNDQELDIEAPSVRAGVANRDQKIKQVLNTNNLRKIDDGIRKTITVKLNRETVSLSCEVNELRREKKALLTKIKELQDSIKQLRGPDWQKQVSRQFSDINVANISVIKSKSPKEKESSPFKMSPFLSYHHEKAMSRYSMSASKHLNESSTQLPSIIKGGHSTDSSRMFGVDEIEGDIDLKL